MKRAEKIKLNTGYIRACGIHTNEGVRPEITGLCVMEQNNDLYYIGCNGHTMMVCRDTGASPPKGLKLVIPSEMALKVRVNTAMPETFTIEYKKDSGGEYSRAYDGEFLPSFKMGHGYVTWQTALPTAFHDKATHNVSSKLVRLFIDSSRGLGMKNWKFNLLYAKDKVACFGVVFHTNAIGVIMGVAGDLPKIANKEAGKIFASFE